MSIVKCKECGAGISSKAEICPQCGAKRKPAMGTVRKAIYAFVALIVLVTVFDMTSRSNLAAPPSSVDRPAAVSTAATTNSPPDKPAPKWVYETSVDAMRKTESRHATITGLESLDFEFPYKRELNYPTLTIQDAPGHGRLVYIEVPAGQFICSIDCTVAMKFDDGTIRKVAAHGAQDGDAKVIFLPYDSTVASLKKAKRLVVEATFYQSGTRQMPFDVGGLVWK